MVQIFSFFGSILGYLLWFLYNIFHNYGVAIIFFTIIVKLVLFPFSIKSQRSMASQTKLSAKQKELQAKYGNNKQKYNEELMKLYEKEGVNPSSGCLTTLLAPAHYAGYLLLGYHAPFQHPAHCLGPH